MKYIAPLKDGKIQHVPVAIKNKDVLVGYLENFTNVLAAMVDLVEEPDEDFLINIAPHIDSSRFNGYVDDGVDGNKMSDEEFDDFRRTQVRNIINASKEHPENHFDDADDYFFEIDCTCGNRACFKTIKEIPEKDFNCDICDRVLIQYLGVYDYEVESENKEMN